MRSLKKKKENLTGRTNRLNKIELINTRIVSDMKNSRYLGTLKREK